MVGAHQKCNKQDCFVLKYIKALEAIPSTTSLNVGEKVI